MRAEELSQDDVTLLHYLAKGMTVSQIAAQTGTAPRRVRQRVWAVRAELGATTNIQAVAMAVRRAII